MIGGLAALLAAGLLVYVLALSWSTAWRLRHPPRRTYAWAVARGLPGDPREMGEHSRPFESWAFTSRGLELPVWDIPGDAPDGPTVVVTHGWGGSRLEMLSRLPALAGAASRVVMWDMRGHGESGGVCHLAAREAGDLVSLLEHLGRPCVLYGYSLGAEVSLLAARQTPQRVLGMVLEAPFRLGVTPARAVLELARAPSLVNLPVALGLLALVEGRTPAWRWTDLAANVSPGGRVLVIHGTDDRVCPPADGRSIAEAAGGEFVLVEGAGHQDLWSAAGAPTRAVGAFLARCREGVRAS